MMISAPLTKSPYCASHSTSASRRRHGVAVLEAKARVLGQRRVVELEAGCGAGQMLERNVRARRSGVEQGRVALAERAAHRVLPGEPDRRSLAQE